MRFTSRARPRNDRTRSLPLRQNPLTLAACIGQTTPDEAKTNKRAKQERRLRTRHEPRTTMPRHSLGGATTRARRIQTRHRHSKYTTQFVLLPRFKQQINPKRQPTRRRNLNGVCTGDHSHNATTAAANGPTRNKHQSPSWFAGQREDSAPRGSPAAAKNGKKRDQTTQPRPKP
jgi:hypothetical protein